MSSEPTSTANDESNPGRRCRQGRVASGRGFVGAELSTAIEKTFRNRRTEIDTEPIAITTKFTEGGSTKAQWAAFVKRSQLEAAPAICANCFASS